MLNDLCTGCGACATVCPIKAISLQANQEGFLFPNIDSSKCINCKLCEKCCLYQNPLPTNTPLMAFCSQNKDIDIRLKSSSGGIFYQLCQSIFNRGGVVYGVIFDDDFNAVHTYAQTIQDAEPMMISKYVQSKIGDSFKQVQLYLKEGRWVLFTGTPCQIAGLKRYLNRDWETLICQDLLCHGVPSPKIWNDYIKVISNQYGSSPRRIVSRVKPWKQYSISFLFKNDMEYCKVHYQDVYMKLFLNNITLRRSCYSCPAKGRSGADITIGDYWGVNQIHPEMDDNKGTSLIIINTEKGKKIYDDISSELKTIPTAIPESGMYWTSVKQPHNREKFFTEYANATDLATLGKLFCKFAKLDIWTFSINLLKKLLPKRLKRLIRKILAGRTA